MKIKKFSRKLLLNFLLFNAIKIKLKNLNIFFGKKNVLNFNIKNLYIIISKKIKGSVKRNKIKRFIKNILIDINNKMNNIHYFIIFISQSFDLTFINKEELKIKILKNILYDKK